MKAAEAFPTRPWVWASLAGAAALVVGVMLVRLPAPPEVLAAPRPPSVSLVDPVVALSTLLRDPTPLFLPSPYTSSRRDYVPVEPGGAFAGFPPRFTFRESELALALPPAVAVPASPAEALRGDPPGAPFLGFGRADPVVEPVSPRAAYVSVVEQRTGRPVFGAAVADARPPAAGLPWQPMEFMAAIDAAGLVGPVVPVRRSGIDDVDAYFARYLAETLRIGQRFGPGFYRVSVGP